MDTGKLIFLFRATIDPVQRQQAEEELARIHQSDNFIPALLQIILLNDLDISVRQAVAIYLKREIESYWGPKDIKCDQNVNFIIKEEDKTLIKNSIIEAVIQAPPLLRMQLSQSVGKIAGDDFPHKWSDAVEKIRMFLQNPNRETQDGALMCLYHLVKAYEFRKVHEKKPICKAMSVLLPLIYEICLQLLPEQHMASYGELKKILKIYFSFTEYTLPLDLITREIFTKWMEICKAVINKPVADISEAGNDDSSPDAVLWRCKKWAFRIIHRMFKRYGSPGNVSKEYENFSRWFLVHFSSEIVETSLKVLDQYRRGIYVSPRVLHIALNCINQGVGLSRTWKLLKPQMFAIIKDVVFPIMCYSEEEEKLWQSNPYDYVKVKFDLFEDFVSPTSAAQSLLRSATSKRKNMLQKTMHFLMQVLNYPNSTPKEKDGALHMLGTLARTLNRKQCYQNELENILCQHIFPYFSSPFAHLRVRAFWCLHYFSEIKCRDVVLEEAVRLATNSLLNDENIPVKVEAIIGIQKLLSNQHRAKKMIEPNIEPIALELLSLISETGEDFLTNSLQKIVCTYTEQLVPIAVDMCKKLSTTFNKFLQTGESYTYMLITIDSLLTVMEKNTEVMNELQPIVLQIVVEILEKNITALYEEAMTLIYDLTCKAVSPALWQVLELIYKVFKNGGFDYFIDMMPPLHNYITVDTDTFLSNERHLLIMYDMCKEVLMNDTGVDSECHAAKLLEVIILQCKGRIDQCIPPFVELVVQRLMREVTSSDLRTMCLQVIIAALYYNFPLTIAVLEKIQATGDCLSESVSSKFIRQWILDADAFIGLHDRKMCVLGLCQLIIMTPRPVILNDFSNKILPALLTLFNGLTKAYALRAQEDDDDDSEDDSDYDQGVDSGSDEDEDSHGKNSQNNTALSKLVDQARTKIDVLSSDEDESCESGTEYMDYLKNKNVLGNAKFDDDSSDDDEYEETELETYTTPIDDENCEYDEFIVFKEVLKSLELNDPLWYQSLTKDLKPEQEKSLKEVLALADQKKAAAESKQIELSGGYSFPTQKIPTSFNFNSEPHS